MQVVRRLCQHDRWIKPRFRTALSWLPSCSAGAVCSTIHALRTCRYGSLQYVRHQLKLSLQGGIFTSCIVFSQLDQPLNASGEGVFRATRDIQVGEELCTSYAGIKANQAGSTTSITAASPVSNVLSPTERAAHLARRQYLYWAYGFVCQCPACSQLPPFQQPSSFSQLSKSESEAPRISTI